MNREFKTRLNTFRNGYDTAKRELFDRIAKLEEQNAELKAALKPFSRYDKHIDDDEVYNYQARSGDVRRAKELTDE